jgi:hypothetical protein
MPVLAPVIRSRMVAEWRASLIGARVDEIGLVECTKAGAGVLVGSARLVEPRSNLYGDLQRSDRYRPARGRTESAHVAVSTANVAVITSNLAVSDAPGYVRIGKAESGLSKPSVVNVSQVLTIDKALLAGRVHPL